MQFYSPTECQIEDSGSRGHIWGRGPAGSLCPLWEANHTAAVPPQGGRVSASGGGDERLGVRLRPGRREADSPGPVAVRAAEDTNPSVL